MTAGVPYSSYVRPSSHVMHIGRLQPGGLTPLPELAAPRLGRLPGDLQAQLKRDFWKRHNSDQTWDTKHAAQNWLAGEVDLLERERLSVAFDDYEIRERAGRAADLCSRMVRLEVMQDHARSLGIEPPEEGKRVTRIGAAKRLSCPRWWRRQLRKHYTRRAESHLRAMGMVHRHRQVYASDRAVAWRKERKARDRALLQELVAVSDAGDQLNLFEVVEKSQANPALRRAELMVRARGFEEVALAAGHRARFFTATCPSAYHRMLSKGSQNPRWQGFTPREGQQWLCKAWASVRSKLKHMSISYYGFRVAEPHHDGTPHWHLLLFGTRRALKEVARVMRLVWFAQFREELDAAKARKARLHVKAITRSLKSDGTYTSATGYIAKYIAKNIDGFSVGEDHETEGQAASESCDRVAAWASAHGVRQFQQLGGPQVSVWRELRKIREAGVAVGAMEQARTAADAGEWAAFIVAVGGIAAGRTGAVQLWKEQTGEPGQYDEVKGHQIAGVQCTESKCCGGSSGTCCRTSGGAAKCDQRISSEQPCAPRIERVRTRCKVWRIERKAPAGASSGPGYRGAVVPFLSGSGPVPSLGPVSITVRDLRNVPSVPVTGAHVSRSPRGPPWTH